MSRWDALRPDGNNQRSFKNNRSRRGVLCDHEHDTNFQSRRPVRRHPSRPLSPQGSIESLSKWKDLVEQVCESSENNSSHQCASVIQNQDSPPCVGPFRSRSEILEELVDLAFSEKTTLSPRRVGEDIVSCIKYYQTISEEVTDTSNDKVRAQICQLASQLLDEYRVDLTASEARHCVSVLSDQLILMKRSYMVEPEVVGRAFKLHLECLTRLVTKTIRQLPAEETTGRLLPKLLLPVLMFRHEHGDSILHEEITIITLCLTGIRCFLQDPLHASAMLAPLVLDVSGQGEEQRVTNPIRSELLAALQSLLRTDSIKSDLVILEKACMTLASAMNAIKKGSHVIHLSKPSLELDLVALERFFHTALAMKPETINERGVASMKHEVLQLLVSVLQAFPDSSSSMSSLVLAVGSHRTNENSRWSVLHCSCTPSAQLLLQLHSSSLDDSVLVADSACAIQEVLRTMPLNLWATAKRGQHQQQYLAERVARGLEHVVVVTKCRFMSLGSGIPKATIVSLCDLAASIMNNICFSNDSLIDSAVDLLFAMGMLFQRALAYKVENYTIEPLGNTMVESMGGKLTPNGTRTKTSVPMERWLSSDKSRSFLDELYRGATTSDPMVKATCLKVLSACVRTQPEVVLRNQKDTELFYGVVVHHVKPCEPERGRIDGLSLFENFLLGRSEFGVEEQIHSSFAMVASVVSSVLPANLSDRSASTRSSALNVYGALSAADWHAMFQKSSEGMCAVRAVLAHCVKGSSSGDSVGESSGNVRSIACKATGRIITQILSVVTAGDSTTSSPIYVSVDDAKTICCEVIDTMRQSMKDTNSSVRSMAMFAIGNLAYELRRKSGDLPIVPHTRLLELCLFTHASIGDKNDKVAGNAIRTSGNLCVLLFRNTNPTVLETNCSCFFQKLVSRLADKVKLALTEATGKSEFSRRTWKQRSVIRKHAWGACNSLALVLDSGDIVFHEDCVTFSRQAIESIVGCIQHMEFINEKVVAAAVTCLATISMHTWIHVSPGSDIVGEALCLCLLHVHKTNYTTATNRQGRGKLPNEMRLLLQKLVSAATISDVCILLKHDEISKAELEFLYEWMTTEVIMDKPIAASCFESFALALQRRDLCNEVSLQQRFASRALQRYRNQQGISSSLDDNAVAIPNDLDSEDCDEL